MSFRRSGDGDNPRLLREQPRERDLRWRRLLLLGERLQPRDKSEVRAPVLLAESRNCVSEVSRIEGSGVVDLAGQKPLAERAERHEADAQLFQGRQDLLLRLAPPQGVLALQRGDWLDRV